MEDSNEKTKIIRRYKKQKTENQKTVELEAIAKAEYNYLSMSNYNMEDSNEKTKLIKKHKKQKTENQKTVELEAIAKAEYNYLSMSNYNMEDSNKKTKLIKKHKTQKTENQKTVELEAIAKAEYNYLSMSNYNMEDSNEKTKLIKKHKKQKTKNQKTVELEAIAKTEYNYLSMGYYKKNAEYIRPIINLGMKKKLDHETLKAWVELSNKYDHIPICIIENRIKNKDSTFLKNEKNTEERIKRITKYAMDLGHSPEKSKEWGSICDGNPHIYDAVIKNAIEHKSYAPDNFLICFNEIQHSNLQVSIALGSDDLYGLYSGHVLPSTPSCSIL